MADEQLTTAQKLASPKPCTKVRVSAFAGAFAWNWAASGSTLLVAKITPSFNDRVQSS